MTSSSDHTMSQERKEGFYSAPRCPALAFRFSGRQWRVAFSEMAEGRSPHLPRVGVCALLCLHLSGPAPTAEVEPSDCPEGARRGDTLLCGPVGTLLLGTQPPPAPLELASAARLPRDGELLILGEEKALWELLPCHNPKASCRLIFSC